MDPGSASEVLGKRRRRCVGSRPRELRAKQTPADRRHRSRVRDPPPRGVLRTFDGQETTPLKIQGGHGADRRSPTTHARRWSISAGPATSDSPPPRGRSTGRGGRRRSGAPSDRSTRSVRTVGGVLAVSVAIGRRRGRRVLDAVRKGPRRGRIPRAGSDPGRVCPVRWPRHYRNSLGSEPGSGGGPAFAAAHSGVHRPRSTGCTRLGRPTSWELLASSGASYQRHW